MSQHDDIKQQQSDHKFDRNLKIVAGVISILGVAATTVVTIMEAEKEIRRKRKRSKPKTKRVTGPKAKSVKALKAPVKKKLARHRPIINERDLLKLEKQAEKVLDAAQQLKEETDERMSASQTEK
jgi:hypothetical protein